MMPATSQARTWTAPDGERFSCSVWEPKGRCAPRAVVVAMHGLSGAALDYEPLGRHLAAHGVVTFAPELRGQGNDPVRKRRGDLASLDEWFADLRVFLDWVRQQHPATPLYCYGESMGAALLTRFFAGTGAAVPIAGLVLASPVVALPRRPAWWQQALFRFVLALAPRFRIDVRKLARSKKAGGEIHIVTRDARHRAWFETASHKLDRFTIRFFRCLVELIEGCGAAAGRIHVPVLVLYAARDLFIQPVRVEEFFSRLGSRDKALFLFPESYHLLLHDDDKALVLARIESWLLPRLPLTADLAIETPV
jgi:alpha-beta hydrolase superfamily lysophospholipase